LLRTGEGERRVEVENLGPWILDLKLEVITQR
jgi:hypothetical protein